MTDEEKMTALKEIFENEDITEQTELSELHWDSLAKLSVMALVKSNGKSVTGDQIRNMKTVGDILISL